MGMDLPSSTSGPFLVVQSSIRAPVSLRYAIMLCSHASPLSKALRCSMPALLRPGFLASGRALDLLRKRSH